MTVSQDFKKRAAIVGLVMAVGPLMGACSSRSERFSEGPQPAAATNIPATPRVIYADPAPAPQASAPRAQRTAPVVYTDYSMREVSPRAAVASPLLWGEPLPVQRQYVNTYYDRYDPTRPLPPRITSRQQFSLMTFSGANPSAIQNAGCRFTNQYNGAREPIWACPAYVNPYTLGSRPYSGSASYPGVYAPQ